MTAPDQSDTPAKRTVFVKSYGCQMNVYDSQRMRDVLAPHGWEPVDAAEGADCVILNTCHIREKAAEKVYSELGRLRPGVERRRAEGRPTLVAVAGCVAQAEGAEIQARQPLVDVVFGPQTYHRLPELLARASQGERVVDTEFPDEDKFERLPDARGRASPTAFLTVQEGCDKFCSFCVVPYTRGAEFSRPVARVAAEAERLAARGVREITLLGQNVNAYHGEGPDGSTWSLARLLGRLAQIDGVERLRYTTSHPNDMSDDLIAAHADLPNLMPYLHLPVQAGSDRVLKAMNRKHDARSYRVVIDRVRAVRPDIALSGDFIVGFPGETDADFEETLRLVEDVQYAQAFSFKYSSRPGTPAADAEQIPEPVKAERLSRLQALLNAQQAAFLEAQIGRHMELLLEKPGREAGQLVGRTPYLQPAHVPASDVAAADLSIGDLVAVEIVSAGPNSLAARTR